MKAKGFVRRIDDLGRIVIPKEVRRRQRIKDGDALEIFMNSDDEIILKKCELESVPNEIDHCLEILEEHAPEIGSNDLANVRRVLRDIKKKFQQEV